jgi:hypothetical protein
MTFTCLRCEAYSNENVPAIVNEHLYTETIVEPTCVDQGYAFFVCDCNETYVGNFVDSLGHDWNGGVVTVEPAVDSVGVMTFTCLRCGETYQVILPATGTGDSVVGLSVANSALTKRGNGISGYGETTMFLTFEMSDGGLVVEEVLVTNIKWGVDTVKSVVYLFDCCEVSVTITVTTVGNNLNQMSISNVNVAYIVSTD